MAQVPLNKFVRASTRLPTTLTQVYSAPVDTAAIMLTILASNFTPQTQTVSIGISGNGDSPSNVSTKPFVYIVKDFQIAPHDVANLAVGKIVMENFDGIYANSQSFSAVDLTLSILETLNTSSIND